MTYLRPLFGLVTVISGFLCPGFTDAETFKVATYNVENLFDLRKSGYEYTGYIPDTGYDWTEETARRKYRNIAEVIEDIDPAIIGLQEIESPHALKRLQKRLKENDCTYPYARIADAAPTVVRCALLSKFPIKRSKSIRLDKPLRDILRATVTVDDEELVIFVNHWKSKRGPESLRLRTAKALRKALNELSPATDAILLGDFNSDYNEYKSIRDNPRLNDTQGMTGINHGLNTVRNGKLVTERTLRQTEKKEYLYNLWLEIEKDRRWSYNFFGDKGSLDQILIPQALYDDSGISYVDDSFHRFNPDYLFDRNGAIFRWQRAKDGKGKHLGRGYSDHLPIYAVFSTKPFGEAEGSHEVKDKHARSVTRLKHLYNVDLGHVDYRLKNCLVIYKHGNNAVIKRKDDRAMFIYKAAESLKKGHVYDLTIRKLYDFYGLREVTVIDNCSEKGTVSDLSPFYLDYEDQDLSQERYQNEVVGAIEGEYRNGYLYYGDDRKINIYFDNEQSPPDNKTRIILKRVRVGYHRYPQLIVEREGQLTHSKQ